MDDEKSNGHEHAWLVLKGFSPVEGLHFDQIFSSVVHFETVQSMLTLATLENWHISTLDVQSAYLYGKLDEEIYMDFPEGFAPPHLKNKVLRLLHALYGLKQAGLTWWNELNESMTELGFKQLKTDTDLFIYKEVNQIVVAIIYVDDTLFCGPSKALVEKFKATFMKRWGCHDLRKAKEFLWINIHWEGHCPYIDQPEYLKKVLERCGIINAQPARTPWPQGYQPEKNTAPINLKLQTRFQMVIGLLWYLMLGTCPDIAYAVTQMVWQSANLTQEHLHKALHICQYLIRTHNYSLVYDSTTGNGITTSTNSDWNADPETYHSQMGFYLKLANGIFLWNSHLQKTTALSSTEANYMALSDYACQIIWIKQMFGKLEFNLKSNSICGDK